MKTSQNGFIGIALLIILGLLIVGGGVYYVGVRHKAEVSAPISIDEDNGEDIQLNTSPSANSNTNANVNTDVGTNAGTVVKTNSTTTTVILNTSDWKTYVNTQYGFRLKYPSDFTQVITGKDTNRYLALTKTIENGKWKIQIQFTGGSYMRVSDSYNQPNTTFRGLEASLHGGSYSGVTVGDSPPGSGYGGVPTGVSYHLYIYKTGQIEPDPIYHLPSRVGSEINHSVFINADTDSMSDDVVRSYGDASTIYNKYKPLIDQIISTSEFIN